ncbi:MAG: hypothetical protein ACIALR_06495 [Blastopirellula sp. JB062]
MNRTVIWASAALFVVASYAGAANAQVAYYSAPAVIAAPPVVGYVPERRGLFGLRTSYRPVYGAYAPVAAVPVTSYYAPAPVTTNYLPATPSVVTTNYYSPLPTTTYYGGTATTTPTTTYYAPPSTFYGPVQSATPTTTYYAPMPAIVAP